MQNLISVFKALADKNRLRIVASLWEQDELCACQVIEMLGVTGATVSRHLTILQDAGIIVSRKDGRWIYFRLSEQLPKEFPREWLQNTLHGMPEIIKDQENLDSILKENPVDICRRQRGV